MSPPHRSSARGGLRARVVSLLWVALATLTSLHEPAFAQGELVLLLVPQSPDPVHIEMFHRIEAELRLHGFRAEPLVASAEGTTTSLLGAQASAQRAFAAIAIAEQAPFAMLQVWIVDSRTGLTRQYRVEQRVGEEATNVVAVRAVDLLRAQRDTGTAPPPTTAPSEPDEPEREPEPGQSVATNPSQAPTAQPSTTQQPSAASEPHGRAPGAPIEGRSSIAQPDSQPDTTQAAGVPDTVGPDYYRPTTLQLTAEAVALSLSQRVGWSAGPSLGAWLTLGRRLRLGLLAALPLWGAVLHTDLGDALIYQQLSWLEVGAMLTRTSNLQLSAAAGGGIHFLQARGQALAPRLSKNDSVWSFTASVAGRVDLMLTEHWSLGLTLRARMFVPAVEVAVSSESARLASPAIEGALGVSAWL